MPPSARVKRSKAPVSKKAAFKSADSDEDLCLVIPAPTTTVPSFASAAPSPPLPVISTVCKVSSLPSNTGQSEIIPSVDDEDSQDFVLGTGVVSNIVISSPSSHQVVAADTAITPRKPRATPTEPIPATLTASEANTPAMEVISDQAPSVDKEEEPNWEEVVDEVQIVDEELTIQTMANAVQIKGKRGRPTKLLQEGAKKPRYVKGSHRFYDVRVIRYVADDKQADPTEIAFQVQGQTFQQASAQAYNQGAEEFIIIDPLKSLYQICVGGKTPFAAGNTQGSVTQYRTKIRVKSKGHLHELELEPATIQLESAMYSHNNQGLLRADEDDFNDVDTFAQERLHAQQQYNFEPDG